MGTAVTGIEAWETLRDGGVNDDTNAMARVAAQMLNEAQTLRSEHVAPLVASGDPSAREVNESLQTAERHALAAQRIAVVALTARLKEDESELSELALRASRELDQAAVALGNLRGGAAPTEAARSIADETPIETAPADSTEPGTALVRHADPTRNKPTSEIREALAEMRGSRADARVERARNMKRTLPVPDAAPPAELPTEPIQTTPRDAVITHAETNLDAPEELVIDAEVVETPTPTDQSVPQPDFFDLSEPNPGEHEEMIEQLESTRRRQPIFRRILLSICIGLVLAGIWIIISGASLFS